jgi:hypothetical protein
MLFICCQDSNPTYQFKFSSCWKGQCCYWPACRIESGITLSLFGHQSEIIVSPFFQILREMWIHIIHQHYSLTITVQPCKILYLHMFIANFSRLANDWKRNTVIHFVSTSAKFDICTVAGLMGHILKLKCVHSRVNLNILASTSFPFRPTTVYMPNLSLT